MTDAIVRLLEKDFEFSIFRSQMCHILKEKKDDKKFVRTALEQDWISLFWNKKKYAESYYILAMLEYLMQMEIDLYASIKKNKLKEPLFPTSILWMDFLNPNENIKEKALEECRNDECGKYFMRYNIVERNIRDVA